MRRRFSCSSSTAEGEIDVGDDVPRGFSENCIRARAVVERASTEQIDRLVLGVAEDVQTREAREHTAEGLELEPWLGDIFRCIDHRIACTLVRPPANAQIGCGKHASERQTLRNLPPRIQDRAVGARTEPRHPGKRGDVVFERPRDAQILRPDMIGVRQRQKRPHAGRACRLNEQFSAQRYQFIQIGIPDARKGREVDIALGPPDIGGKPEGELIGENRSGDVSRVLTRLIIAYEHAAARAEIE